MSINRYSLSADEVALIHSLLGQNEVGISILQMTYGKSTKSDIENKLLAAGHSLLARKYVRLEKEGAMLLQSDIAELFAPIIKFSGMVQFIQNSEYMPEALITNIYLNEHNKFTAYNVTNGVVHNFYHGKTDELPYLVTEWVDFPIRQPSQIQQIGTIGMAVFADLMGKPVKKAETILKKNGINETMARALAEDAVNPTVRGSVVQINITPKTMKNYNFDEAGRGVLYIVGKKQGWVLVFEQANDNSIGHIIPCDNDQFQKEISNFLR